MSKKGLVWLAIIVGLLFVIIGFVYATKTAGNLPTFFPGYEAGSDHFHVKHSIAAFILAVLSFVFAWFQSGPKQAPTE